MELIQKYNIMKKATKVKEQIEEIKKRGLNIDCSDDLIESYFSIVGYYSLGFYLFPFEKSYPSIVNRTHKYKENARFSDVILLYKANTELRFIILEYLSFFENFFKTLLIYKVSNKYHNNPTWFVDNTILKIDIGNFNKIYNGLKNSHKPIYNHHKNNPKDKYAPAWKTLEYLTFGQNQYIYKSLLSKKLKKEIAEEFNVCDINMFLTYLQNAVDIRNICAHGGPLFDYNSKNPIKRINSVVGTLQMSESSLLYTLKHLANSMKNIDKIKSNISSDFILDVYSVINKSKYKSIRHFFK